MIYVEKGNSLPRLPWKFRIKRSCMGIDQKTARILDIIVLRQIGNIIFLQKSFIQDKFPKQTGACGKLACGKLDHSLKSFKQHHNKETIKWKICYAKNRKFRNSSSFCMLFGKYFYCKLFAEEKGRYWRQRARAKYSFAFCCSFSMHSG